MGEERPPYISELLHGGTNRHEGRGVGAPPQAHLGELQRLQELGRLAGAVAHDFNNLLTVIAGCAQTILGETPQAGVRECAEDIRAAVARAAALVGQLLAFSGRRTAHRRPVEINALLTDFTDMIRRLLGRDIEIRLLRGQDLWTVHANPGQIEQVLMNLVVNARDAMPDGGTLTLETRNVLLEADPPGRPAVCSPVPPGEYVLLSAGDTGCGMGREVLERLFEPFFTTKQAGKGTGLGLSTLYAIVKENGGFIRVHSQPAKGSVFELYLPRFRSSLPELRPTVQAPCACQ